MSHPNPTQTHPSRAGSIPTNDPSLAERLGPAGDVDAWSEEELEDESPLQADETTALFGSMIVHVVIIVALAIAPLRAFQSPEEAVVIVAPPMENEIEEVIEEVDYSEVPSVEIGTNADGESQLAEASAEMFSEIAEIPSPVELEESDLGDIEVNRMFNQPIAPMDRLVNQKGTVGQGETGAAGAVDRLTYEILQSMEERPTLVVWLFDQSGSLHRQRREIRDRFDRIYEELGIVRQAKEEKKKALGAAKINHDAQLLTSVIGFGDQVKLYTETPTEDVDEIKSIVDNIEVDSSGTERVFTAVRSAVDQYKPMRKNLSGNGPLRNVMFVVVTDERGDDQMQMEKAIESCRRYGIPVYCIGVPAPFGRATTLVKYVDPDPKYDQTPQWAEVDQGPESLLPERVQLAFSGNFEEEPVLDSGFGPYALTRLSYETGGIYFTVHPNRNVNRKVRQREVSAYASNLQYFFDPVAMSRYRPDYLSPQDYMSKVKQSPLRQALVNAAQMKPVTGISRPRTRFQQQDQARLAGELTRAQQDAARLEQPLINLARILDKGMKFRESEESPRWQAGYDLAMGRVLAQKVRTESYNGMLAKAKLGMKFKDEKNNTWVLEPSDEVTISTKWKREAETARTLLENVVNNHPDTPWALLAQRELDVPIGWVWQEEFTPPPQPRANRPGNNNNNNNPRPPRDDQKRMLQRAPKRPVPKL